MVHYSALFPTASQVQYLSKFSDMIMRAAADQAQEKAVITFIKDRKGVDW